VASRDAARNRSPGRPGAPPARHYDLAARSSLHGFRRIIPETEARPPAKNRHGGAPRGARPSAVSAFTRVLRAMGTQGASQAPGRAASWCVQPGAAAPGRPSALRPPLRVGTQFNTRAQSRRGNEYGCLTSEDVMSQRGVSRRAALPVASPPPLRGRHDGGDTRPNGRGAASKDLLAKKPPPVRMRINTELPSPARGEGDCSTSAPAAIPQTSITIRCARPPARCADSRCGNCARAARR
jgi:hypothetical protein